MRRSSPSTSTRAPSARRPAAIPAIRSDSLWRSSPAPRMTVVPAAGVAARQRTGISSIAAATSAGPRSTARSSTSGRRGRRAARRRRRRARRRGRALLDVGAHRAQDVDDGAPGRVDPDVAERQLGVRDGSRRRPARRRPPRRRPGPARRPPAPPPLLRTVHGDPPVGRVLALDRHAARPQHPLRVVARGDRFADRRPPLGPQPRQQDRRLDLCARHRRREVDRPERGVADHGQGREGVVPSGVEHRAHRAQWFDDTSDRTAAQRSVAVEDGGHRQPGEHPANSRRLVPELPQSRIAVGLGQAVGARRDDPVVDRPAVVRRPARPSPRAPRTIPAVERTSAPSPAPSIRLSPVGQRGEHQRPVADRLVAGQPQLAAQAGARADAGDVADARRRRGSRRLNAWPARRCRRCPAPRPTAGRRAASGRARGPGRAPPSCRGTGRGSAAARRRTAPRPGAGGPRP